MSRSRRAAVAREVGGDALVALNTSLSRAISAGDDAAHYLKLTASPSGSFAIFNSRTGTTKDYAGR